MTVNLTQEQIASVNSKPDLVSKITERFNSTCSNVDNALNAKANSSDIVALGNVVGSANGTASAGTATTSARSDHVHPQQTTVAGNAGTATKLATARTISATGDVTASGSFDGSANLSLAMTLSNSGVTAGTYQSVTVDAKGRVTAGSTIANASTTTAGLMSASDKSKLNNYGAVTVTTTATLPSGGSDGDMWFLV